MVSLMEVKNNLRELPKYSLNAFNNAFEKRMNYDNALKYAAKKHEGQKRSGKDKAGNDIPYIKHPIKVAKILEEKDFGLKFIIAGLFHDLLEDTNAKAFRIILLSNIEVYKAVVLLTKPPKPENFKTDKEVQKQYMKKYFDGIRSNEIAHMVKLADRIHNLKESFMQTPQFIKKYIEETEEYFIDLAKGTVFEQDLNDRLDALKRFYEENYCIA